jgi:CRP/FNR family transcriptional regulator
MDRAPGLARAALRIQGQRLAYLESQVSWARRPAAERLAAALVYLEHKFGRRVPLTRAEIGALAGTATETAMRTLSGFARRGWVRLGRGGLEVRELEALRREAASET